MGWDVPSHPFAELSGPGVWEETGVPLHIQPWQPSSAGKRLGHPGSTPPCPATGISQMNAPALELAPLGSCSDLETLRSNNLQGTRQTSFILFNLQLTEFLLQFSPD